MRLDTKETAEVLMSQFGNWDFNVSWQMAALDLGEGMGYGRMLVLERGKGALIVIEAAKMGTSSGSNKIRG